ncbi:hypothetical protein M409DRAFT_16293 [Zasmidium cellare ATCC 36951]|uniref:Uncharacterized protein n=1 Tax=Zasmidium cellare ATCC 36951 TaxID=1080233 RepID=A0A6A6D6R8_ZASCE|nr:uncharacterized protein M409DRAFT_16293 [Zasmidium cellare ATCC 36951]KAF2174020.1 hypothetical protein M409DRAFT_16293 [Zasmidium cellare ATCC 36951]
MSSSKANQRAQQYEAFYQEALANNHGYTSFPAPESLQAATRGCSSSVVDSFLDYVQEVHQTTKSCAEKGNELRRIASRAYEQWGSQHPALLGVIGVLAGYGLSKI